MEIVIFIIIALVVLPYIIMGVIMIILSALAIGGVAGLPVSIFFSVKNYILSINENIENKIIKTTMIAITFLITLLYIAAIIYFLTRFFN